MCIYVGATVRDKRFPEKILGTAIYVNATNQTTIIETTKGWTAMPTRVIEVNEKMGGRR